MAPRARRRSSHDPRACRLLRGRGRIKFAFLREATQRFRRLVMSGRLEAFPELRRLIEHEDRATRSDLLENICLVVEACGSRTDLGSGRVGWKKRFRTSDGRTLDFVGLPRKTIANWTDAAESTVSHTLTLLRRAGILHGPGWDGVNVIAQPIEKCDVTADNPRGRRGLPCVRRFHESFWIALGMGGYRANLLNRKKLPPATPAAVAGALASKNAAASGRLVAALAHTVALERPPDSG